MGMGIYGFAIIDNQGGFAIIDNRGKEEIRVSFSPFHLLGNCYGLNRASMHARREYGF